MTLSVDEFMLCWLGMNDSVWSIDGIVLTGKKQELDENTFAVSLCPPEIPT